MKKTKFKPLVRKEINVKKKRRSFKNGVFIFRLRAR